MRYHWLNRNNNDNLIVFFTGWSFDENPFKFLDCNDFDVLFFYDYNNLNTDFNYKIFEYYKKLHLLTWSMGTYTAYLLRENFINFDNKISVNGTVYPVDDNFGIPQKTFLLTLKYASKGLEGKFYNNIFQNTSEYELYLNSPVKRTIDNRVSELDSLYKYIINNKIKYEKFYDFAYISNFDKIIPTKNQINFWQNFNTDYKLLDSGHFPYYNYKNWKDLICY